MTKFNKEFEVYVMDGTPKGDVQISSILKYMVETSIQHDYLCMKRYNKPIDFFWVLCNWDIHFFQSPRIGDIIRVETYESNAQSFFAFRNFNVYRNDELIIKGMTKWVMMDQEKLTPVRIPEEITEIYGCEKDEYSKKDYRLSREKRHFVQSFNVRKSDIDSNNHVNNIKYINWAMEGVKGYPKIKRLRIVYKNQTYYGDIIELYTRDDCNGYEFEIKSGDQIQSYGMIEYDV